MKSASVCVWQTCTYWWRLAAVDQRDDQGVERAALARLGIVDPAQASEVHLGKLAGGNLGDADRDAPLVAEAAVLHGEAMQRAVRDLHASSSEQLMHFGEPKPAAARVGREPGADRVAMPRELQLALPGSPAHRQRLHALGHPPGQGLVGGLHRRSPAQLRGASHPASDRRTAVARHPLDGPLALPAVNPPQYLQNLPHRDLPVRHLQPPLLGAGAWTSRALGVGSRS
jgi:hypothetical protein